MAKTSACALQEETQNSIQERTALYINVARRFACHTYSIMRNYEWLLQCTGAGAISIVADGTHYQISVFFSMSRQFFEAEATAGCLCPVFGKWAATLLLIEL